MSRARTSSTDCRGLREISLPGVTIEVAERLIGDFATPDGGRLPVVPLSRVRGVARPTPKSHIIFELWLPENGWNGRYYQLGNGGFAGNIDYPSLAADAARGNAVAVTDTGHGGGSGDGFDARWAAGEPERVADYGHRSIKATSDAARALIDAYYGRPPAHCYFVGCSNGGRQALMAAQRYPDDWDGIIAGAPANRWTRQLTTLAALQHRLRTVPGAWLPISKLPAIQRAALAACPAESVRDGVASDPELCRFNPFEMICQGDETDDCMTPAQAESVRQIIAAGYDPTSANVADNWSLWIVNPDPAASSQLTFATQAFRHLLGNNAAWAIEDFDPERDAADAATRAVLDAGRVDYSVFRERGGKIISYFGWADALIAPRAGLDYYRSVAEAAGGADLADKFYRLFMVPGMTHCQGGPGPASFGQSLAASAMRDDRQHDIRRAIEAWVEQGIAPAELTAARYIDDDPANGVEATRKLYPAR